MQRRAFFGVAVVGGVSFAGCLDWIFGDENENDEEPDPNGEPGTDPGDDRRTDEDPETVIVTLRDNQFDPRNLSVERGATVRWQNASGIEHTVTSASDNWDVDLAVPVDQSQEYTFEADGVYDAYCSIHGAPDLSGMAMKIAVGDASIEDPLPDDDYPY